MKTSIKAALVTGIFGLIGTVTAALIGDNYYSEDFFKSLLDSNTNMSIQNNTMYIGKIVKDKTALTNTHLYERQYAEFEATISLMGLCN